jgi:hypothetical protein
VHYNDDCSWMNLQLLNFSLHRSDVKRSSPLRRTGGCSDARSKTLVQMLSADVSSSESRSRYWSLPLVEVEEGMGLLSLTHPVLPAIAWPAAKFAYSHLSRLQVRLFHEQYYKFGYRGHAKINLPYQHSQHRTSRKFIRGI